jgi:peptidyl-prolyl cis-trans isomerase D
MLDALRKGASGWLAQLFIAVLVISFAAWGIADVFRGFRADTVATVGKTDISINDFARQYDFAKRQLSQRSASRSATIRRGCSSCRSRCSASLSAMQR